MARSGALPEEPVTVKLLALVPVPPGVVTLIVPVVALVGTMATICVLEFTVYTALTPLNFTAEAELKFVPVMVTLLLVAPLVGVKLVMLGVGGLVRPSILARNADAIVPGKAVKKL